jgi:hypothetical protein
MEQLLDKLLGAINDPYVIACILAVYSLGWLISKAKEVGEWKGLFSKDRTEDMRRARDLLQNSEEEAAFYEEAMRQEMFYNLIGIRCRKEYRETCQRLVIDGIASTEAIRLAYLFIYKSNSKIEVRIGVSDLANALFLIFIGFFRSC